MIDVEGHAMHVYAEGDGEQTIVFLSGGGTSTPVLDFKPLWTKLSTTYTIAVVEKAGYGWSEVATVSREIDVILKESRTALELADVQPPYVLGRSFNVRAGGNPVGANVPRGSRSDYRS